jgi:hypothetical protein
MYAAAEIAGLRHVRSYCGANYRGTPTIKTPAGKCRDPDPLRADCLKCDLAMSQLEKARSDHLFEALLALGGLEVSKAKRLRGLESENARLKKLLARQRGAKGPAGKKMVTPTVKREAVAHLRSAFDMSERRARRTINCVWMTMRYRSRRPDDSELRQRLRARH